MRWGVHVLLQLMRVIQSLGVLLACVKAAVAPHGHALELLRQESFAGEWRTRSYAPRAGAAAASTSQHHRYADPATQSAQLTLLARLFVLQTALPGASVQVLTR